MDAIQEATDAHEPPEFPETMPTTKLDVELAIPPMHAEQDNHADPDEAEDDGVDTTNRAANSSSLYLLPICIIELKVVVVHNNGDQLDNEEGWEVGGEVIFVALEPFVNGGNAFISGDAWVVSRRITGGDDCVGREG